MCWRRDRQRSTTGSWRAVRCAIRFDGGSTSIEAAGTGGTNDIAVGGAPKTDIGAGGVGGVANVDPTAGESSGGALACPPRLIAEWNTHYEATACPGTAPGLQDARVHPHGRMPRHGSQTHHDADQLSDFGATDPTPYCKAPCTAPDDWFFRNLKLQSSIGATLMGPMDTPVQQTSNDLGAHHVLGLVLLEGWGVEVAHPYDGYRCYLHLSLGRDSLRGIAPRRRFRDGNIPYIVVNNVSPDKMITVKRTCAP